MGMEMLYKKMWERFARGEKPDHVAAIDKSESQKWFNYFQYNITLPFIRKSNTHLQDYYIIELYNCCFPPSLSFFLFFSLSLSLSLFSKTIIIRDRIVRHLIIVIFPSDYLSTMFRRISIIDDNIFDG